MSGLSRIFLIAGAVVFGATAGASGPSVASAKAHQAYELNWVIAPHDFPSEPLLLKKRSRIVETRLYPETLFQTPVELKAENGELVAPVGAQFIRLESDAFIACSIAKGQVGLVSKGRICLVDQDDDRRFDGFFKRGFGEYWWFELSGQIPENLRAMAPVALPSVAPEMMIDAPYFDVNYERILDNGVKIPLLQEGGNQVRFYFSVGKLKRRENMYRFCASLIPPHHCANALFPSEFAFGGFKAELLERQGESIKLRIVAPFKRTKVKFFDTNDGYTSGELLLASTPLADRGH